MADANIAARLEKLEKALHLEVGERIRADHGFHHRLHRVEQNCLIPAVSRKIVGPIPWLWRWLGLSKRPRHLSEG